MSGYSFGRATIMASGCGRAGGPLWTATANGAPRIGFPVHRDQQWSTAGLIP
jgi:hypothetical protein